MFNGIDRAAVICVEILGIRADAGAVPIILALAMAVMTGVRSV